jgi:hypothetical protein
MSEKAVSYALFPVRWQSVIDDLWAREGRTIGELLPEIVRALKVLPPEKAEQLLLLTLSSPKAKRLPMLRKPVGNLHAGDRATDLILDVAGFPKDSSRPRLRAEFAKALKAGSGIDVKSFIEAVKSLQGAPKEPTPRKRSQRAAVRLGYERKRGRPPKIGQK